MTLLRCLNCLSHWVPRQSSKRLYSLYCAGSSVMVNKQLFKGIYCCQYPFTSQHKLCFSTSSLYMKRKKVKGWEDIFEDTETRLHKGYACERGKDAVRHSVLVSRLQKCSSVSEQIETFSSVLSFNNDDKEKRLSFCNWLEDVFKIYLSDFKLHQFGSSVTGMGFKGCDLDVCLLTNCSEEVEENITVSNLPTSEDVESGKVSRKTISNLEPLLKTKFLKEALEKHPDISQVLRVNGRCPILKFYNSRYDIFCDLSFKNEFSLQNAALIKFIGQLEVRYLILLRIVRYWAKYCGLVDGLDKFSSYAFSLLVLHFLQTRNPPILPPVNEIVSKSVFVQQGLIEDTHLLNEDLKKFSPSTNFDSAEKLLQEFFFFYLDFDFNRVIVTSTGCSIPTSSFLTQKEFDKKFEFNTVSLQDPFKPYANITVATRFDICKKFRYCLQLTCEAFQNESFSNPEFENFGLSSIFLKPSNISKRLKELQENTLHTIEVPSMPNAASKVKEILEYGLLFQCVSFYPNSNTTLLKLRCKTYNKTWLGRDLVSETIRVKDNISHLEKEHLISKEIAAKTDIKSKQILCEFDCECKKSLKDNETNLIVHLNFKKASPVGLFLEQYIPCTLRML